VSQGYFCKMDEENSSLPISITNITSATSSDLSSYRLPVGIVYLLLPISFLCLYFLVFLVMVRQKSDMKLTYHKILINIGLADMGQLVVLVSSGTFTLVHTDIPYQLNKVCGGLANSFWLVYGFSAHLLAFNRFIEILFPNLGKSSFQNGAVEWCWRSPGSTGWFGSRSTWCQALAWSIGPTISFGATTTRNGPNKVPM